MTEPVEQHRMAAIVTRYRERRDAAAVFSPNPATWLHVAGGVWQARCEAQPRTKKAMSLERALSFLEFLNSRGG